MQLTPRVMSLMWREVCNKANLKYEQRGDTNVDDECSLGVFGHLGVLMSWERL